MNFFWFPKELLLTGPKELVSPHPHPDIMIAHTHKPHSSPTSHTSLPINTTNLPPHQHPLTSGWDHDRGSWPTPCSSTHPHPCRQSRCLHSSSQDEDLCWNQQNYLNPSQPAIPPYSFWLASNIGQWDNLGHSHLAHPWSAQLSSFWLACSLTARDMPRVQPKALHWHTLPRCMMPTESELNDFLATIWWQLWVYACDLNPFKQLASWCL